MRRIDLEDVARQPAPGLAVPTGFAFSPDGRLLTYLAPADPAADAATLSLWVCSVATGERRVLFPRPPEPAGEPDAGREAVPAGGPGPARRRESDPSVAEPGGGELTAEEALRRERRRVRARGVTDYHWAESAPLLLVSWRSAAWILTPDGEARRATDRALDPRLSPDGRRIAFVRDRELWVHDLESGEERALTAFAPPGVSRGLAEYVAQEEMDRMEGFWWSGDGTLLAYQETDERAIPPFVIPNWAADEPSVEEHRYPFTGGRNARVRLGVVSCDGGETRWLDLGDAEYLARVLWHPDGRILVQTQSRDQRRLELRAYDPRTGEAQMLLVEEVEPWVNLHGDLRVVPATGEFLWSSERSGVRRLTLHKADGTPVRDLTDGAWPLDGVLGLDSERRRVALAGSPSPPERHVWVGSLDGGSPRRLSAPGGQTGGVFARDLSAWVEVRHSVTEPPAVTLRAGDRTVALHEPPPIDLDLVTPEMFTFAARDGETLHGMLYRPARLPAPLLVRVYGGHAQQALDSWVSTVDLGSQYLCQEGFAVLSVDNRGSARRGLTFEAAVAGRLGDIEVRDQVDGVRYAQSKGWVDGDRVGIYGWSYGGYVTIMGMLTAPEVFRAGVAGAPVTAWDGYDTHYTERYLGTPAGNPDGYRESSCLTHAGNLAGRLLLVHGMLDENVHFRHTVRFLRALGAAGRSCEVLPLPGERHGVRDEARRRAMQERIVSFLRANLS